MNRSYQPEKPKKIISLNIIIRLFHWESIPSLIIFIWFLVSSFFFSLVNRMLKMRSYSAWLHSLIELKGYDDDKQSVSNIDARGQCGHSVRVHTHYRSFLLKLLTILFFWKQTILIGLNSDKWNFPQWLIYILISIGWRKYVCLTNRAFFLSWMNWSRQ